ncbi:MAG: hypothetical protein HKN44_09865 [Ilumatobacter sp.]|nr:hypothetical protein [Ilumatobacter sp.]
MRQLFTWRFFAVVAALAGLALVLNAVVVDDDELTAVIEPEIPDRRIDLIAPVLYMQRSPDFSLGPDGTTTGFIDFVFDDRRVMRAAPGTAGEIECEGLNRVGACVVLTDLLGDAVIWFAVLPEGPRGTVELPPILDLEGGYALFENGWQIPYPPVIERRCDGEDIVSFSDFLRRFGPGSTTIVDIETQQVLEVRCAGTGEPEPVAPTTTELVVLTPIAPPTSALDADVDEE